MEGLSKKETEVIAHIEFSENYFFRKEDIKTFFESYNQFRHFIHKLIQKKRIIKVNRNKYYLIPIKARKGKWTENPFIVADEIFNGENYFVGGWAAANYWNLTEQIPMQYDIWTTKRQGMLIILGIRFKFHRTTTKKAKIGITEYIKNHPFKILSKQDTKKWLLQK